MPALIFWDVDTQYDFIYSDGRLYVPDSESIIPKLEKLSRYAHEHSIVVVASADNHELTDPEISDAPDFRETFPPHCMRGTPGQQKVESTALRDPLVIEPAPLPLDDLTAKLQVHNGDILLHKQRFDVFSNPNAGPVLEILDPDEIVLYGVALDVCNKFAIEGILERRPEVTLTLVTDATRPINPVEGERLLSEWRKRGVRMESAEALLTKLRSQVHA